MNQSNSSGSQELQTQDSPSPNGNGLNTTGNTPYGGIDNPAGLIVGHGTPVSHRFLVKTLDRTGRGPWIVDAMFPRILHGETDLYAIDEAAAAFLTGIVRATRPQKVLETGTHRGRSTRAIAEGLFLNQWGHLWTVDMDDYGLMTEGAIRDYEKPYVTQIVGHTPAVYGTEPLQSMMGIDFAFIDAHRAENCILLVDNARDAGWPEVEAYFKTYKKYPSFLVPTMSGMQMIWMCGYDAKNR